MTNIVQCKCGKLTARATVTIWSSPRRPDDIHTALVYSDVGGSFLVANRHENVISCSECKEVAVTIKEWK